MNKIEVRRNRDISFTFEGHIDAGELFPSPAITEEMRQMLDEGERIRKQMETEWWLYFESHPTKDQLGNIITEETHEIGFDVEEEEFNGMVFAVARNIWVRPKKSEYKK